MQNLNTSHPWFTVCIGVVITLRKVEVDLASKAIDLWEVCDIREGINRMLGFTWFCEA